MNTRFSALAMMAGLAALGGCKDRVAQERIAQREANIDATARILEAREASRPGRMERTLALIREQHARDVRLSRQNVTAIDKAIREDVEDWQRRQPAIREGIEEHLRGDPENIKRTAPEILY